VDAKEVKGQPPLLDQANSAAPDSRNRWVWLAILVPVSLAGLILLNVFSPENFGFYPRCGLYALTGLHCPGCGSLRALHHLTHGRIEAAADSNALLVLVLALVAAWCGLRLVQRRPLVPSAFAPSLGAVLFILGVGVVFGVLRNLPWHPFAVLAP